MVIVNAIKVKVSCFREDVIWMSRTVNLFIFLHEFEWVVIDVAVEVHIWPWMLNVSEHQMTGVWMKKKNLLDTPIPPIFLQQRMFEEKLSEPRSIF